MKATDKSPNRRAFPKFALWLLIGAAVGFCAGIASSILGMLDVEAWTAEHLAPLLSAVSPWGIPVSSVILLGICFMNYRSAKRMCDNWDGEDDTTPDAADQKLNVVLLFSSIAMILNFFFLGMAIIYTDSGVMSLIVVGEMTVSLVLIILAQQKTVDLTRKMNPEKQVSVYDTKFQEKWYENCDEAERAQIGQASFRAFRTVNLFCPILWVVLLLLNYVFPIGLLPMATVLLVWAVLEISYIGECIRLGKRKGVA